MAWFGSAWMHRLAAVDYRFRLRAILVILLYLMVPLITFQLIMLEYPQLDPTRFRNATMLIIPSSLVLIAVALAQRGSPKGTGRRLLLDAVFAVISLVWMIAVIGGNAVIHSVYGGHAFTVDVTPLMLLGVFAAAMNLTHDYLQYLFYGARLKKLAGPQECGRPAPSPGVPVFSPGFISADMTHLVPVCGGLCEPPLVRATMPLVTGLSVLVEGAPVEFDLLQWVAGDAGSISVVLSMPQGDCGEGVESAATIAGDDVRAAFGK